MVERRGRMLCSDVSISKERKYVRSQHQSMCHPCDTLMDWPVRAFVGCAARKRAVSATSSMVENSPSTVFLSMTFLITCESNQGRRHSHPCARNKHGRNREECRHGVHHGPRFRSIPAFSPVQGFAFAPKVSAQSRGKSSYNWRHSTRVRAHPYDENK